MKKTAAPLMITFMLIIIGVMFVFMCLPLNHSKTRAVAGMLDLRGQAVKDVIFPLTGQWHFYYDTLLTPTDLAQTANPPAIIDTPSLWTDAGYPAQGAATYRLLVKTDDEEPLMLYVPEIPSAYTLWVNGKQLGGEGVIATKKESEVLHYSNTLIPVTAKDGEIDLCLQVSNFSFLRSGMYIPLKLGRSDEILAYFYRTRAIYTLGLGCIAMTAFYHLSLYVFRRSERLYLVFSLLCAVCFLRFCLETDGLNHFFQILPGNDTTFRLYRGLFFGNIFLIMLFSFLFFEPDFLKKHKKAVILYFLAAFTIWTITPLDTAYSKVIGVLTLPLFIVFTIARVAVSEKIRQVPLTRLYLVTMVLSVFVGLTSKVFFDNALYMLGFVTQLFLLMSQSLILSQNYAKALASVEDINLNLEQIVADRTRDLANTNNAMKELISNISHDLKTPLSVLSVNLEKIADSVQPLTAADYQKYARVAYHKNLDLQRLTQNLFEVSRIEAGQSAYATEWVSLRELFAKIQEKYGDFLESQELFFDVSFAEDTKLLIDPQKIWSVFDNIIYNAVRHTDKGGSIFITAVKEKNSVAISVKDTGCGIVPEHLTHIFERFYKVSSTRGAPKGASGLGLYIVKKTVEGFGGSVAAKSELGKGTSIIVSFKAE